MMNKLLKNFLELFNQSLWKFSILYLLRLGLIKKIKELLKENKFSVILRREKKFKLTNKNFLLVDTFGELGIFFKLSEIAIVGGSFSNNGGHNPIETKDFNSLLSKFNKLDCAVFGISKDDMKSHDKFKEKYKVKFDLLSDEKKEALKAFKVWGKKKFMGKEFMGVIRSTFVIKNNKIIKEWRSVRVKDHAKEVLEFIKNNS